MALRNVAVAVLRSIIEQLLESRVPLLEFLVFPIKAYAVEPIDAILRNRTSHVCNTLCPYPYSKFSLLPRYVAVAVLRLILEQFLEACIPLLCELVPSPKPPLLQSH